MGCPICGKPVEKRERARHLPRFFLCPHCGGFFTDQKPRIQYEEQYFTEKPKRAEKKSVFSPLLDFFLWLRMRKIRKIMKENTTAGGEGEKRILDYGCGNGKLVAYLRKKGFDVDGYDPEVSAVALAHMQGLPVFGEIPEKQYDLIMFWHCLEHTCEPLKDTRAVSRFLKPDGKILVAVPHGGSWEAKIFGESWFCYDWPFHMVHFTPRALSVLLSQSGFKELSIDYFNPEYTVSSLAQTFLNLFLPKNALYSFMSARRQTMRRRKLFFLGIFSLFALVIISPILFLFFIGAFLMQKTAAFIVIAQKRA